MKKTSVKKYRRTAAMLAATFAALVSVSGFSLVQAEESTETLFPVLAEMSFVDILKDQMDRDFNALESYNTAFIYPYLMIYGIIIYQRR